MATKNKPTTALTTTGPTETAMAPAAPPTREAVVMDANAFLRAFEAAGAAATLDVYVKLEPGMGITAIYRGPGPITYLDDVPDEKTGEIKSIQTWYVDMVLDGRPYNVRGRLQGDTFVNGFLGKMVVGTMFGLFCQGVVKTRRGFFAKDYLSGILGAPESPRALEDGSKTVVNVDAANPPAA